MICAIPAAAMTAIAQDVEAAVESLTTENVAKVGNTEYASIDEAIAAWTNGTTLTLLADVTLSDVIKLSSTEYHILDLGTYTMTAAYKKDAIQIVNNARSSASYALDIKADATNPGSITATGKAVVRTTGKSGVKDRPIIRFYNGIFTGSYVVYHSGSNGTNCPQFQFHGGEFNGTVYTNRALNQFYGGTFTGSMQMSVDSSAYTLISGGTFAKLSNMMGSALNSGKFTIGSGKGVYDKEVYVDDNGNYVIASAEPSEGIEAAVAKKPGTNDYLAYSKVATEGELNYTDVYTALKNNTTATVTVYADEVDLTNSSFKGTIVVPEGEEITIVVAEGTTPAWTIKSEVENEKPNVTYEDTNGNVLVKDDDNGKFELPDPSYGKVAQIGSNYYESLSAAIADATAGNTITLLADITEDVTINKAVTIDGAGKTYTGAMELKADTTIKNVNFDGKGYNGYAVITRGAQYVTIEDCKAKNYGYGLVQLASATALTTVKNVTVSNMNYGVKVDYSSKVVIENSDITAGVAAVLNSNYGEKEITIKDSKLNILGTWTRNNTIKTTYVFEGANTIDSFIIDAVIDTFKLAVGATLTAPNEITVTTDAKGKVLYENGYYYVKLGLLGSGTEDDPYQIGSVDDLIMFRDSVNAGELDYNASGVYVALTANIDMADIDWNVNIGDDCNATFDGIFDGNNKTIYNLTSTETQQKGDGYICTGLFGAIAGDAVIKNLTIENVKINTSEYTGNNVAAVVGFAYNATGSIENVTVKGNIQINANYVDGVGAIVGYAYGGKLTVKNCVVNGTALTRSASAVNGQAYVGGIIGYAGGKVTLTGNTAQNVDVNASSAAAGGVAGIILGGGVASSNTVMNVNLTSAHANWKNAVGAVAGTFTGTITVSKTDAKNNSTNATVGVLHADKPTAPLAKAQAVIGDVYYGTFADAYAAAKAGDTITLLDNMNLSQILVIDKAITLDGNGKTLTSTAGRAINVSGANGVTIKNLIINASGERAINVIQNATNIKIDNVTATASNYTVNVASSAPNAVVAINKSTLNGLCTVNVAAAGADVTVTDSTINCNDNNTTLGEAYAALGLIKEATGGKITVTGSKINVPAESDSVKARNAAEGGVITIDGSSDQVKTVVAIIDFPEYNVYYGFQTLSEAVEFATSGQTVTLIRDVEMSDILVINKAITLDGNGHKLTSTAGRAINVSGADGVTIKNLIINASGERAINVIQNATNVTIDNVIATASNYTVNVASSAPNAVVVIKGSDLTGLNVVNVAAAGTYVTIENTKVTCNDQNSAENYAALSLHKDAVGGKIIATGVTFDIKGNSDKASNGAKNGVITIDGKTDEVSVDVAYISYGNNYYGYTSLEAAIAAANTGETITLLAPVVVAKGETITLDKDVTITYTSDVVGEDMFTVRGTLNVAAGKITYVNNTNGSNVTVSTISAEAGSVVNVTGGIIENKSVKADGSSSYPYAIDMLTNGSLGDVTVTIEDGKIYSNYVTIRQFNNGDACKNTLKVTGGNIYGAKRAIQIHFKNNAAHLAISGGEIKADGDYALCFLTTSKNVSVSGGKIIGDVWYSGTDKFITGGTYTEEVDLAYIADGYALKKNADTYGITAAVASINGVDYATLADAVKAVPAGAGETTITLLAHQKVANLMVGHTYAQQIILDLNGKTISATDKAITSYRAGTVLTIQNGTVSGNSTGGTINVAYGGALVLGEGAIIKAGGQATVICVDDGSVELAADGSAMLVGGKNKIFNKKETNTILIEACINDYAYGTFKDAIAAANDNAVIKLVKNLNVAKNDAVKVDGYYTFFDINSKTLTIDLNGKTIKGTADGMDKWLIGMFLVRNNGHLTLNDSIGGAKVTVTAGNGTIYALLCNYDNNCSMVINGGSYIADKVLAATKTNSNAGSLIYSTAAISYDADKKVKTGVIVNGGTFNCENAGEGENASPWIFNAKGRNDRKILVNGGSFNTDVFHQYWVFEVDHPYNKALKYDKGMYTVVDAVAYVEETYYSGKMYTKNVGYASLQDAIDSYNGGNNRIYNKITPKEITIVLLKNITIDADDTITIPVGKSIILDLNGKTITGITDDADKNNDGKLTSADNEMMFDVRGTMTVRNGTITLKHTSDNLAWNGCTEIFYVAFNGTLNVENAKLENLGGSDMAFAIDVVNATNTTVNIINSTVKSSYIAVRIFNNASGMNNVTIKESDIIGVSRALWVHIYTSADNGNKGIKDKTLKLDIYGNGNTYTATNKAERIIEFGFTDPINFDANGNQITL